MGLKKFKEKGVKLLALVSMHLLVVFLLLAFLWVVHWLIGAFHAEHFVVLGFPLATILQVLDAILIFGFFVFVIQDMYEFITGRD